MLARRFTIVCLLVTLFGMAFAILVADAGSEPPVLPDRQRVLLLRADRNSSASRPEPTRSTRDPKAT